MVRHQVGHGEVIVVADPCDQGAWELSQVPAELLIVEDGKVFSAAATPGQHQRIQLQAVRFGGEMGEHRANPFRHGPLHRNRNHQQGGGGPAFPRCAQHVRQG